MASVIIKRDTLANINATPITDGQLLFSTDQSNDNDKIYADIGSERKVIGGRTEVVNDLTSTDIDKALSANMGKELSDSVNIGFTTNNPNDLLTKNDNIAYVGIRCIQVCTHIYKVSVGGLTTNPLDNNTSLFTLPLPNGTNGILDMGERMLYSHAGFVAQVACLNANQGIEFKLSNSTMPSGTWFKYDGIFII